MKKTMLALMATVGLAFGAKAVDPLNSTGFESYTGNDGVFAYYRNDSGEATSPYYWVVTNPSADLTQTVLTAYGVQPQYVPWEFTNKVNETYLKVDTGNDVLYRSVESSNTTDLNAGTPIPDGGLYFDANVQFTASDAEPDYDSADKLIVWMKATEGDEPSTNLMVTAGVYNEGTEKYDPIAFEIDGNYSADTWYRLTVKAMVESDVTKFVVYVDDSQVKTGGVEVVFDSLVAAGEDANYDKLTAVGFKGTGAVDNLVWTTDDPFPVVPPTTVALTVTLTDENFAFTELAANAEVVDVAAPAPIVADVDDEITFVAKVAEGFTPTVAGYVLQKSAEKDEDECYAYTFTVTVTQEMINNGLTLTINVTEDEPPTPPTPSEDEKEIAPGGKGSIADETGDTYTKEAVEAMVTVVAPNAGSLSDEAKAAFDGYFTKNATYNSDAKKWEVTVTLNKTALEGDVDTAVAEALDAVVSDAETKTIGIPAGFYYQIEYGTTVGLTDEPLKGLSAGSVAMPTLGDDAGFFKVSVDTTSFEAGE